MSRDSLKEQKKQWEAVNTKSIEDLRSQVKKDRVMQRIPGCRYSVLEMKHLFEVALEDLDQVIETGIQCGSVFHRSVEQLRSTVSRVEEDAEYPFFALGQMLGAARLIGFALRQVLDAQRKVMPADVRAQLLDITSMFESVKEG